MEWNVVLLLLLLGRGGVDVGGLVVCFISV